MSSGRCYDDGGAGGQLDEAVNETLIRHLIEEIGDRRDVVAATALYATDAHNHGRAVGSEGIQRVYTNIFTAFPDWHETIEDLFAEGDRVVAKTTGRGTHLGTPIYPQPGGMIAYLVGQPPTGRPLEWGVIHVFRIADGKIVEHYARRDDLGALQRLGVLPGPE